MRLVPVVFGICAILAFSASPAGGQGLLGMDLPSAYRPFSVDSPWNTPIPDNPPVAPNSEAMIQVLARDARFLTCAYRKWTAPLFVLDARHCEIVDLPSHKNELHPSVDPDGNGRAPVPCPSGIWPDPEADGHLILVDPVLQKAWELSQARMENGRLVSASRIFVWDLRGSGVLPPFSGRSWWTAGAVASGMPFVAGLVTHAEFMAGTINHALICAMPTIRESSTPDGPLELCPPASRTDGKNFGHQYIPMGARLQLDPDLDLDALGLSAKAKVLARAMQRYGIIVGLSSRNFQIYLQNMDPSGTHWEGFGLKDALQKIPLASFRVLDCALVTRNAN